GAVGAAEELVGEGEEDGVVGPAAEVELVLADVGAAQLLVLGPGLVDLAGVDLDVELGRLQAAHAGPLQVDREAQAEGVAVAVAGGVEADGRALRVGDVGLAAELEGVEADRQVKPFAVPVREREAA